MGSSGVSGFGIDIVIPICGNYRCVNTALSTVVGRSFSSFRIVIVSSKSASSDLRVVGRGLSASAVSCRVVRRSGTNMDYTEGHNLRITRKSCLIFISTSSCVAGGRLSRLCGNGASFDLVRFIGGRKGGLSGPRCFSRDLVSYRSFVEVRLGVRVPFRFYRLVCGADVIQRGGVGFAPNIICKRSARFTLGAFVFKRDVTVDGRVACCCIRRRRSTVEASRFGHFRIMGIFRGLTRCCRGRNGGSLTSLVVGSEVPGTVFKGVGCFLCRGCSFSSMIGGVHRVSLFSGLSGFRKSSGFGLGVDLFLLGPGVCCGM